MYVVCAACVMCKATLGRSEQVDGTCTVLPTTLWFRCAFKWQNCFYNTFRYKSSVLKLLLNFSLKPLFLVCR